MNPFAFMTNANYLAQMDHFLGGYSVILTVATASRSVTGVAWALFIGVVLAALKELWFDLKYETPKQTVADSTLDFVFYLLGGAAGTAAAFLTQVVSS